MGNLAYVLLQQSVSNVSNSEFQITHYLDCTACDIQFMVPTRAKATNTVKSQHALLIHFELVFFVRHDQYELLKTEGFQRMPARVH